MYYQYKLIAKVVTNLIFFHSWVFLQSGDLRTRRPWGNCKASVISWLWCAGIYTEGTYFKDAPTIVVEFHPIAAEHNSIKKLSIADVYLISHIIWRRLTVCSLNVMIHIQSDHIMRQWIILLFGKLFTVCIAVPLYLTTGLLKRALIIFYWLS